MVHPVSLPSAIVVRLRAHMQIPPLCCGMTSVAVSVNASTGHPVSLPYAILVRLRALMQNVETQRPTRVSGWAFYCRWDWVR